MRLSPRRWTIRSRITAVATLLVAATLVLSGVFLVTAQRRQLQASVDDTLEVRADDLTRAVADGDGDTRAFVSADDDRLAQLTTLDGTVVAASPGLEGEGPVAEVPSGSQSIRTLRDLPIEDDPYRVLSRRIDTESRTLVLHIGENVDDLNDSVRILTTSLIIAVPSVTAVLGVVVWLLVGRTLRPVEAMRREVADIGANQLHRRVPRPHTNDEIARLASTMNAMLDRLEEATERQRQFVADASHELRSPLTRIRTEVEVALSQLGDADPQATLASVLEETDGLQRLLAELLHLARSDAGVASVERESVDLDDIVIRETRRLRANGHAVDIERVSAARVLGDAGQLTRAVRNLVDNAARHAASQVTVTLGERDGKAVLTITDDGVGVPAADRDRIFERFTRLDHARTRDGGGAGLGLAITRDIVEAHGGSVALDAGYTGGAKFVFTLPVAP